jgi:hypothetical protein
MDLDPLENAKRNIYTRSAEGPDLPEKIGKPVHRDSLDGKNDVAGLKSSLLGGTAGGDPDHEHASM